MTIYSLTSQHDGASLQNSLRQQASMEMLEFQSLQLHCLISFIMKRITDVKVMIDAKSRQGITVKQTPGNE